MFCILLVCLAICSASAQEAFEFHPIRLDELEIEVGAGRSREVGFTNKEAGVYYTESNGAHRSGWQGWRIMSKEMMESYGVSLDGAPLRPADALRARVSPHQLVRDYAGGAGETLTLLDSVDALALELRHAPGQQLSVRPYFSDVHDSSECETQLSEGVLQIARKNHLARSEKENYPAWLGIVVVRGGAEASLERAGAVEGLAFSPASLTTRTTASSSVILFVWGDSRREAVRLARALSKKYAAQLLRRKERMERLLNESYVRTKNPRFDKALNWAKLSSDALVMNQIRKGIFAGLPWFDNYWGRDTFIALPGATLVTGKFAEAREILRSFAAWQSADAGDSSYGRIPNLVTTASTSYNTADGTPRFVAALDAYQRTSGDTAIVAEMYPVVKRSIEGTLRYHADSLGFLTHGDAETWMDAVGPSGAWSARGNRANDIQALWSRQLEVGERWAKRRGDAGSARRWAGVRSRLTKNFRSMFVDTLHGVVFDHLNSDGSPDRQFRPNQLFTFGLLEDAGQGKMAAQLFDSLTRTLVYQYGVASLSQEDRAFHPYHHHPPYYVQDASYHNGIVWTWLSGAWIDQALAYDAPELAMSVTENMVEQILDRGAIGTLSELVDAAPRPGEALPRLSGTYSQAWSLAEFIRNFYEGYLGIRPDVPQGKVSIAPRLPRSLSDVEFIVPFGAGTIHGTYGTIAGSPVVDLVSSSPVRVSAHLKSFAGELMESEFSVRPGPLFRFWGEGSEMMIGSDSGLAEVPAKKLAPHFPANVRKLKLATAVVAADLPSLQGPSHRMLSREEVKRSNASAELLLDAADPEGDDAGDRGYVYPTTASLKGGSLDILHCRIAADTANLYVTLRFRRLSNPGWHPEYGFQLTFAALAIDRDAIPDSGRRAVGMNAQFQLRPEDAYESIVYIGGGLRLEDAQSTVIAEYLPLPGDEQDPLGNASTGTISFSLPLELIGQPSKSWRYTLLVGAQDDHGGAGIGEFRSVGQTATEWSGGGKQNPADANIYDVILPR